MTSNWPNKFPLLTLEMRKLTDTLASLFPRTPPFHWPRNPPPPLQNLVVNLLNLLLKIMTSYWPNKKKTLSIMKKRKGTKRSMMGLLQHLIAATKLICMIAVHGIHVRNPLSTYTTSATSISSAYSTSAFSNFANLTLMGMTAAPKPSKTPTTTSNPSTTTTTTSNPSYGSE